MNKICFKCNELKSIDYFYKHPNMPLGVVNKCKECNKIDVKKNYQENIKDENWLIKERKRCVDRNRRLGYNKKYALDTKFNMSKYKSLRVKFNFDKKYEAHHWNYNLGFEYSFIVLTRKEHYILHNNINREKGEYMFKTNDGELLDSIEKHMLFIKKIGLEIFSFNNYV